MRTLVTIALFILSMGPISSFAEPGPANEWVLRGTIVARAYQGIAIIEHIVSGEQVYVRVDELMAKGYRLKRVYSRYALVQGTDRVYRVMFGQRILDGTKKRVLSLNDEYIKRSELTG